MRAFFNHREQSYTICRKICATGDQFMKQLSQPQKKTNIVIFSHLCFLDLKHQYKIIYKYMTWKKWSLGEQRGLTGWEARKKRIEE